MADARGRWGVPVAELVLVVAVWASLQLAASDRAAVQPPSPGEVVLPADVPGFRSDVFFLPDEELLGFIEVPAGPFLMGSDVSLDALAFDNERWSAAEPQGTVDLPTFYLGRYEVTVAQFAAFAQLTGRVVVEESALQEPPNHPVANVAWTDAVAYARWLSGALGESPDTPAPLAALLRAGWKIVLPSEAEWEKAARGDQGWIYPWGDEAKPDRAIFGRRATAPVGALDCPECRYGLADMSGNVWEWTRSPYQPYPYNEADDREDLDVEALWVMRGGAFSDTAQNVRAAVRGGADPGARRPFIGFRVALVGPATRRGQG